MPTYRTPGVYINEITTTPPPIMGVATAITAFVDVFVQGPLQQPVNINSSAEFKAAFGATNTCTARHSYPLLLRQRRPDGLGGADSGHCGHCRGSDRQRRRA